MRTGRVAGVQILISPWFLILLILFSFSGMLAKVIGVFASVLWHEAAHATAARLLGYTVREVELLPFGGVARIDRLGEADSQNDLFIALTGPVASFVLAAGIAILSHYIHDWDWLFFFRTNLMLGGFNLIPALPLDGGRILRAWLSQLCGYRKATTATVYVGWLISFCFVVLVVLQFLYQADVNLTLLAAAGFIVFASRKEMTAAGFRAMRILSQKKADMIRRGVMPTTHFTAVDDCLVRDVIALFQPEQYHFVVIVDHEFRLRGSVTETDVWESLPEKGMTARIGEFL